VRINLDYDRGVPVYRQIYEAVVVGLSTEELPPDEQLPTIHTLASQLRVNPNTVARAYRDLERDGYIRGQRGRGTFPVPRPKVQDDARDTVLRAVFDQAVTEAARHGITARQVADYFRKAVDDEK